MDKVFGLVDVVFSELTVVTDSVTVINDRESIASYNLSDTLIADGAFVRQKAVLDLVFFLPAHPTTRRRMTFSIQQADGCEDVLYYQVVATLLPCHQGLVDPFIEGSTGAVALCLVGIRPSLNKSSCRMSSFICGRKLRVR